MTTISKDPIGKIVVGVDGSVAASEALLWTIALARQTGAEIIAVFVLAPPTTFEYTGLASGLPIAFDPQFQAEIEKTFRNDWCNPLAESGLPYRALFAHGRPPSVIAAVAEEVDADLLVVGRRGRGGIAELVLGSVSHQLSHHCPRPVVLISRHEAETENSALLVGAAATGAR